MSVDVSAGTYTNPLGIRPEDIKQTPIERLSHLLTQASESLQLVASKATSPEDPDLIKATKLVEEAKAIVDGHDEYLAKYSSPAPPTVDRVYKEGHDHDWAGLLKEGKTKFRLIPQMSAGPYEGVVLQHLARIGRAKTVLEIGMFTGTTTISIAVAPSVTKVVALDIEPYLLELNKPNFEEAGVAEKIDVRVGDALESLDILEKEGASFDLVFIDADKPAYIKYFDKIISSPTLLAKGGLITADNVAGKGGPWVPDPVYRWTKDIHNFNEFVRNHPAVDVVILPIEDGLSLIRRKGE